ncbi:MarR family winged helix-turn-helix transcriptional regulator [Jatrophihabitans fulvus]
MTDLATKPDGRVHGLDRADVAALADSFGDIVRTFTRLRTRWLAAAEHDVEWSGHVVLKLVHTEGPLRAGAIAEALQSDPSTVSRQVAGLVRDGLLERRSDPDDGRASLLVLTDRARSVIADHDEMRLMHFAEMLSGWTDDDVTQLATLMGRFARAYDAVAPEQLDARIRARRND